ncbi:MAG TPA: hypothetical protein VD906_09490 [Caulobacteraceae bacterium]|nr:hypothetical protein [Caulobacteraceae bacterium]
MARGYRELRAELARMSAALALTEAHLARLREAIAIEAEDAVIHGRKKKRQFGRSSTTWTDADEREYQRQLGGICARRAGEFRALRSKAARQRAAVDAFRTKHRFNDECS